MSARAPVFEKHEAVEFECHPQGQVQNTVRDILGMWIADSPDQINQFRVLHDDTQSLCQ